jgi:hypothetical protein
VLVLSAGAGAPIDDMMERVGTNPCYPGTCLGSLTPSNCSDRNVSRAGRCEWGTGERKKALESLSEALVVRSWRCVLIVDAVLCVLNLE